MNEQVPYAHLGIIHIQEFETQVPDNPATQEQTFLLLFLKAEKVNAPLYSGVLGNYSGVMFSFVDSMPKLETTLVCMHFQDQV